MKQDNNQLVWPTPSVLFWEDWLAQGWRNIEVNRAMHTELPMLLNEDQELSLWEMIIRENWEQQLDFGPLQHSATAKSARNAWHLLRSWNLELADLDQDLNQDTEAFRIWAREFSRRANAGAWLSRSELGGQIGGAVSATGWCADTTVRWLGFDTLTPSQQALRQRLNENGIQVEFVADVGTAGAACYQSCREPSHEIESAARWARALLERGERGPIGVVFLDLGPVRDEVEHTFHKILHPEQRIAADPTQHSTFHLSLGQRLVRAPVIAHALLVLACFSEARPYSDLSDLIHSPFIRGGMSEHPARGQLDLGLRKSGLARIQLDGLETLLTTHRWDCPVLGEGLDRVRDLAADRSQRRSPAAWADLFASWLQAIGWPGDRVPNSTEYQAIEAWRDSLARFAGLGVVTKELRLHEAIRVLTRIVSERIFQPRTPRAPVQIMGIMEAGGMEFSHLWLAGMSDEQWPPAPRPNPFLPHALQRLHEMPGASAKHTLEYAAIVTRRLLGSAAKIVISYPQRRREQPLKLSPLFAHAPEAAPGVIPVSEFNGYSHQLNRQRPVLEPLMDRYGPQVSRAQALSGGVGVIRDQAACPFRAFTRHRLHAKSVPEIEPGLSAAERGSIVHQCLARIWRRLGEQSKLLRASPQELSALITAEVSAVLSKLVIADSARFRREFVNLERRRLVALIEEWFEVERSRAPFQVIASEQETTFTAVGIEFLLRADRVDRCEDGSIIVIDYKTGGNTSVHQWFDDRPGDPQLPIYLLSVREPVNALAFAQVRRGQCELKGLGAVATAPGIQSFVDSRYNDGRDWNRQQRHWRTVIEQLVTAIRDGEAAVDPKSPNECQYCDVSAVCRVFENTYMAYEEDADG
jgi:probable DNA repair protein